MIKLPDNAPFAHQQSVALNALLPTLNPAQAAWLSGYFAALAQVPGAPSAAPAAVAAAPAAAAPTVPLTVLYGSESGNSETCAFEVVKAASAAGFKAQAVDMGDYDASKFAGEKNVLIVVSTWGEGDPPERAVPFHEFVMGDKAPRLEGMRYSVCALGDTSYADFCQCGKEFDARLAELGATRLHDRQDCDVDFDPPFRAWLSAVMPKMVEAAGVRQAVASVATVAAPEPALVGAGGGGFTVGDFGLPVLEEAYGKKRPFPAPVKDVFVLNGTGSKKRTVHVELGLEGSGFTYEPGDVLGVLPTNCEEVTEDMLRLAGFRGDEIEEVDGQYLSLHELLQQAYDVTSVSKSLMTKYAPLAKSLRLDHLLMEGSKDELNGWLWGRELRDLFLEFPPAEPLSVSQFLGLLRKMPPRLYSIASSLKAHPGEVHLTVAVVTYNAHGKDRKGVCSTFLGDRCATGSSVPCFIQPNKNFKLPSDPNTPIIMVGPGTGIAPFRAFVEERQALGAKGRNWLFFGDWNFLYDFYYQTEWQDYLKKGLLTRMDVAFSRDSDQKVYVQHRMQEHAKELYAWLAEGAHFYVCGDANRMAKDVHQTLIQIFADQGGMSLESAEAAVDQLKKDKRYQRDVY